MPRVGKEAAAVGQHADEVAQQAQAGQRAHLLVHAVVGIAEPPGGAHLHLARDFVALERADQRAQHVEVGRVEAVQDGPGQLVGVGQLGEQAAQRHAALGHADHVKAGVGAELFQHLGVGVAQAAVVDLHDDVVLLVHAGAGRQQVGHVSVALFFGRVLAGHRLLESDIGQLRGIDKRHIVKAVVGGAAAHLHKELQPFLQRFLHAAHALELAAHDGLQLVDVLDKAGLVDVQRLVRAEGGGDNDLDRSVLLDLLVPLQAVDGVVGRADHRDVALLDQAAHGHLGVVFQLFVAQVPDLFGRVAVEHAVIAEVFLQLQVAPGIHRVANGHFQRLGKLLEALAVGLVAGDVLLRHAVGTHDAPLIVVAEIIVGPVGQHLMAAQPNLGDVLKAAVLIDLLRRNVAVIVDDGQVRRVVMVQMTRGGGIQKEILVHKCFHIANLLCQRAGAPGPVLWALLSLYIVRRSGTSCKNCAATKIPNKNSARALCKMRKADPRQAREQNMCAAAAADLDAAGRCG